MSSAHAPPDTSPGRPPREFGPRVQKTLGAASAGELSAAVESLTQLLRDTIELADNLYHARLCTLNQRNGRQAFSPKWIIHALH